MRTPSIATVVTGALLAAAAAGSFLLPTKLSVPAVVASTPTPPDEIRLMTLIRDLKSDHPDFNVVPAGGFGHYAGNVATSLGPDGRPVPIQAVDDFEVTAGGVVPGEPFASEATILGAEITFGGDPVPITVRVHADAALLEPFGTYDFTSATDGDVNDGGNPRASVFTTDSIYAPGTVIALEATSWLESAAEPKVGYETILTTDRTDARNGQVATQITIPTDATVSSITAYLNSGDGDEGHRDTRYALYADAGGEPGALLAETAVADGTEGWHWFTIDLPDTPVTAGTYWLALAQSGSLQAYKLGSNGGQTRRNGYDAEANGFQSNWSGTTSSGADRVSIYATLTETGPMYAPHMTVNAGETSPYVYVLKDGDPVPAIPAMASQATILDFVEPYVDIVSGFMTLAPNEAIYLFELGTTNLSSPAADFQDLVVLVRLASDPIFFAGSSAATTGVAGYKVKDQWRDSASRTIAPHAYVPIGTDNAGNALADSPGTAGANDTGGITSAGSFRQWFTDELTVNLSTVQELTLVRDVSGVYEYLDSAFHPIDGMLLGNDGDSHNHHFTLAFNAQFTYDQSGGQFIEFSGGDGAWIFIHTKLMLDLGGVRSASTQYLSLDRLSLVDGQTYDVHFFYAQRDPFSSDFNLRTNIVLGGGEILGTVTKPFD
ncbi:MAG: fibro-slime domain-containing protein [Planctomycetes bacterium]|nr:fibro-slime domain-containing protein [Planctomycetota bacterium]